MTPVGHLCLVPESWVEYQNSERLPSLPACLTMIGMPSGRDSLKALKNLISETGLHLSTTDALPENRTPRCRELCARPSQSLTTF
jgi:hypothetical protein